MKNKGLSPWHPAYVMNYVFFEFILLKKGSLTAVLIFVTFSPLSPTVSLSSLSLFLSRAGGARKIDSI